VFLDVFKSIPDYNTVCISVVEMVAQLTASPSLIEGRCVAAICDKGIGYGAQEGQYAVGLRQKDYPIIARLFLLSISMDMEGGHDFSRIF
jgi:hypothetical protein